MKKHHFLFWLAPAMLVSACSMPTALQNTIITYPPHPVVPVPEKLVVANLVDVKAQNYRDNKDELFVKLIEETLSRTAEVLGKGFEASAITEPGLTTKADSVLAKQQATHGVFITKFNAYFDQTRVEVTKTDTGKEREAFYDIVVEIGYSMRSAGQTPFDTTIVARRYHSSRSVLSGLLAAGPNIVSNRSDALEGALVNVDLYAKCFFEGRESRGRWLYVAKDFEAVGKAIQRSDYEAAFQASEKLANVKDPKISAKAYYNCAVLLEQMGRYEKVKPYLQESLRIQSTFADAREMLRDYWHQ
ncbi:MAG: tetratricopeptide repeat protein [Cyclobacteriaceae bacterium]|nr:tetratricopeptide repeat protein [Cyclobacteriaceae bacterium]